MVGVNLWVIWECQINRRKEDKCISPANIEMLSQFGG